MANKKYRKGKIIFYATLPEEVEEFINDRRVALGGITNVAYMKRLLLDDGCLPELLLGIKKKPIIWKCTKSDLPSECSSGRAHMQRNIRCPNSN